ncbi:unnamed protein product [Caenorhabditis sp. 36 PRJEB53466]|nr:unnamed protein product [Caenorhabditis sp. 36 PRJEB53466]
MPDDEPRRSMVGAPPSTRRGRGGATPASATPVTPRTSARASKRVKKEEPEEEEYKDDNSDAEKSEEEESEDSGDDVTPSRKNGGGAGGGRKRKRAPLTDYHLKKKKILARKAQREAEREREKELGVEEEEVEKEPTPPPARKPPSFSNFSPIQLMQDHILRKLIDKDPEQYFAYPVTPAMAPDYKDIIKEPMDLQTVREKIEDNKYPSLPAMKQDCQLIVANALLYNQPNTVFYLAANRLSHLINYYFGEQYLRFLFHNLPFANQIPFELVGITPLAPLPHERHGHVNSRKNLVKDDMTSDDCLKNADAKVRDRLSARLPNTNDNRKKGKLGFLSERNGTVVLNVVAGYSEDKITENDPPRRVTIGDIVGPLEEGTTGMIQMADHRLYSQAPMNYLNYGPYSSFAPMYDSTWSTMTKEDTDLFLRTYGDKSNATDVITMRRFVSGCEDFSEMVEKFLDTMTDGEHSRAMKELEKNNSGEANDEKPEPDELKNDSLLSLLDDVTSINNLGIETGFLHDYRQQVLVHKVPSENVPEYMVGMEHMDVQQQLDHIGQEIKDLAHLQETRLCQPPPTMLMTVQEPGPVEQKLAESVQQHLAHQLATHTAPEAFVNDTVIHDAMGVDVDDDLFSEFFVTQIRTVSVSPSRFSPRSDDVVGYSRHFCVSLLSDSMWNLLIALCGLFLLANCCSPDVKFEKDHHRRKELEDKFVSNLAELKNHEEILLKAVEAMKNANEKKEEGEIDYMKRIAEIEKELKATKEDHARLLEKHDNYMRGFERPRTWSETISKYTGDAFGRLLFNGLWGAIVVLLPLLIRPFQRRWLTALRGGDGPTIEEVSENDEDGVRISNQEVKQILDAERKRKKALKAE